MNNLIFYLNPIIDPRNSKGIHHKQTTTLVIMIMAIMCGHTGLNAITRFARSHRQALSKVMRQYCPSEGLAVDGRRVDKLENAKSSEIHKVPELLTLFERKPSVVTRDALRCQKQRFN